MRYSAFHIFPPGELFLNDPLIAGIVTAGFLDAVK
jgi:hypothetical protein